MKVLQFLFILMTFSCLIIPNKLYVNTRNLIPCYDVYIIQDTPEYVKVFSDFTSLETERIVLRKVQQDDLDAIHAFASDSEVTKYTSGLETSQTKQDTQLIIDIVLKRYKENEAARWAIVYKPDNKVIGICGFVDYSSVFRRAEIGYVLCKNYWGKGIATEAAQVVIDFGFKNLMLNRIEATCDVDNKGSAHVLEKLNMTCEGILRQHLRSKGKFQDRKMYSILKSEWEKIDRK